MYVAVAVAAAGFVVLEVSAKQLLFLFFSLPLLLLLLLASEGEAVTDLYILYFQIFTKSFALCRANNKNERSPNIHLWVLFLRKSQSSHAMQFVYVCRIISTKPHKRNFTSKRRLS